MGIPVLILGESGSGKSTSLRNFGADDVGVFNVASKMLPFKSKLLTVNKPSYSTIIKALSKPTKSSYVIDDSQYLMCFEMFDKVNETGYTKFTEMAKNFYDLIQFVIRDTPNNIIVYFLHHVETTDQGNIKAKTSGKMLDNQLTLEGLFSLVLLAKSAEQGKYVFETQTDGTTPCKSPMGMFDTFAIENDLKNS